MAGSRPRRALGALIGVMWAIALVTLALLAPRVVGMAAAVAQARTAHALVSMGARACDAVEPRVPMLHGLGRLLHEAERRAPHPGAIPVVRDIHVRAREGTRADGSGVDDHSLRLLEYDRVTAAVAARAAGSGARSRLLAWRPAGRRRGARA